MRISILFTAIAASAFCFLTYAQSHDSTMIVGPSVSPGTTDVYASGGTSDSYLGVVINNPTVYEPDPPPPPTAPRCWTATYCSGGWLWLYDSGGSPYWQYCGGWTTEKFCSAS
jgi:hypothetical protein